ncbi:MAG: energy transducer TonB [Bacteroidetes bacterium]|nr:energy transducer TonB [Bacteroidota bacterium]
MKKNKINKLLISISLLMLSLFVAESINCQPWKKPRKKQYNKYVDTNDFGKRKFVPPPDTVMNRDIEINIELISRLAIMEAYGTENARINGQVVLELQIDSTAGLISISVLESTEKILRRIAINATEKYFKKYKPLPAKKDGVAIGIKSYILPVIFDMSIVEDSNQNR